MEPTNDRSLADQDIETVWPAVGSTPAGFLRARDSDTTDAGKDTDGLDTSDVDGTDETDTEDGTDSGDTTDGTDQGDGGDTDGTDS
jgi:hypothetical protein